VKAFTNSMLLKENEISSKAPQDGNEDMRAVFFDYLTWFMVINSIFLQICRITVLECECSYQILYSCKIVSHTC